MSRPPVPPSGRAIRDAVTAAVAAVANQDPAALHDAGARLRAGDELQARDVLHVLTLGLIEQAFPDGLDGDDVRTLLSDVLRPTAAWLPDLDSHSVVLVLAGTLAVLDPDAPPAGTEAVVIAYALAVNHLLGMLEVPLNAELARTFDTIRTSQTMDLP